MRAVEPQADDLVDDLDAYCLTCAGRLGNRRDPPSHKPWCPEPAWDRQLEDGPEDENS